MSEEPRPSSSSPSGSGRPAVWEPPSPEELQMLLPKYEITALLGRGGMGAVYKGRQLSLDRPVAIKILSAELDEREQGFAERFKNEAKAMGQLNHPGIVSVHDFGLAEGGLLYIGMEFVAGTDVSRMIAKQKRLPPDHAMAITAHVCDALAYAHGKGIIHRDIKPANIMVGYDGVVKVADFGLAKMTKSPNSGLTQSGMAMGTLHYMAPEALMLGSSVDHRADIYAVGVMLYQMLTGKLPQGMFDPPSQQIPGLDPRYDDIVKKAIRDDREVRYQSVLELRADLDAILTAPVARVEVPETGEQAAAPAALPTQARPQRTAPQTAPNQRGAAMTDPAPKKRASPLLWSFAGVVLAGVGAVMFSSRSAPEKTATSVATSPTPAIAPAPKAAAPAPATPKTWPVGPNHSRVGQFRAWSAVPNDPAIDLSPLLTIRDVKQVHMHQSGWVVLRKNGTTVANAMSANSLMGIRRICPGYGANFALIDDKGQLRLFGVNLNDTTRQPPANLGPVKDAYIAPHYHVALQEDGKLVFWGKGFDGIKEPGNSEWKTKPVLPPGRKAVAISSSDLSLAVKLDDGTLLAWHIDRGALKLPTEFGPGKTAAFAITRNDLLAVPTDGSATLFWPLDVTKPVHRLPGDARAATFVESHRDVLGLDAKGRPFARPAVITSTPAIKEVLSAIPKVKAEHISAHLLHGNNLAPRLIWYEDDPAAAKSATPVTLTGWPADGPFFRHIGRFKVWHSEPNPPLFGQLGRLKGIEDVKQVYQGSGVWVVLRQNGETITSEREDEQGRKNIARICPGIHKFYGLIDREGGFEALVPDADKFPDRKPPPGLKAKDAFLSPGNNFLLTPEGQITVWGKSFDGINQPPENSEWPARPVAPAGRRFTAISHAEFHLACQLENQTLKLWRNIGPVEMPPSLAVQKFRQFETSSSSLYGILDNGLPVSWKIGEPQLKAVPGLIKAESLHAANGKHTVYFLTPEGRPHFVFEVPLDAGILDPVLPYIHGARSDLISIRVEFDGKSRKTSAWVFWFDEQSKPAAASAPMAAAPATVLPAPAPSTKPRSLDQVPDYVTRVANYQKARHAQLADLAGKYRSALSAAREEAKKSGVLADVNELDSAVARITALADEIEKNRSATEVKPLPALPPLGSHVPQRLKDLRTIFDRELVKTESMLVTALDQSLAVVQTDLVKASELDTAKSLETRRKEIVAVFPKPVVEAQPPKTKPALAATAGAEMDLMDFSAWSKSGNARWLGGRSEISSEGSDSGYLYRSMPYDDFELTGEFMASAEANGGVLFHLQAPPSGRATESGYEMQLCGSQSRDRNKTGTFLADRSLIQAPAGLVKDDAWAAFRIRCVGESVQGWVNGWEVFDTTLLPASERARGALIALQQNGVGGRVAYRALKVAQLRPASSATASPSAPAGVAETSQPSAATKDAPFANSLGMKFVPVPGTKVLMCIHETRRQDYEVYAAEKPGVNSEWTTPSYKHKPLSTAGDHPVVMVDRSDALAFCEWLTARENLRYRLPYDREWSQAAGLSGKESEKGTPFSLSQENKNLRYWGEEWPPKKNYLGNYSDQTYKEVFPNANAVGGGYTDGHALTSPVMSFAPNRLGIYDLDGNVWERCQDFFDDPAGEKDLARGSYWAAWYPGQLLISHRETRGVEKRSTHGGFRVVIEAP